MAYSICKEYLTKGLLNNKSTLASVLYHFDNNYIHNSCKNYAMKSLLPIKWVRPEKIPCHKPEKSGDLKGLYEVDKTQLLPEYSDLDELKNADENVKKLFTLEYHPYKKTVSVLREHYLNKVKRHEYDERSPEARVAKMTADIRDMQKYVDEFPYDRRAKVRLKETIDKRKRLLKYLRTWDYKCFEYILEKLNLSYKPFPAADVDKRIERKRSLKMLTKAHCDKIVSQKLLDYKATLEQQQEEFLIEKMNSLKWIMAKEASYGLIPSVSEEEIKSTEQKLGKLSHGQKKKQTVVND